MKVLVVIGLIALLLLLLYRRLRPYHQLLREFIKTIRHFQTSGNSESGRGEQQHGERLVRCEACDIWIPAGRALSSTKGFFCSRECLSGSPIKKQRAR